ncbi:MerR family transcriptional regulator [Saccharomonospora xinjiangensis]|uniref:MerR family transcriptional regulator n=1 Tax=Saccharomonospora xinjiangensis TaxID=75294 RepID=UPI001070126B|nr:MerR family transcriptional regulator [Saccharomonospora xinjiangensis]QBQ60525.1 PP2C-family Ser/Thr phosphatase [Saccharomonospora xinjiangensis]
MASLSIGEFATACGLTPKALRLYDELGLLPPARVDALTGYRHYDTAQLDRARLIAWLRGIGMPLARIRLVCDLPAGAAGQEIATYWKQVEADLTARRETVSFLLDRLSGGDDDNSVGHTSVRLHSAVALDRGLVRTRNQDAAHAAAVLFAVADGFGLPENDTDDADGRDGGHPLPSAADAALHALRHAASAVPPAQLTTTLTSAFHSARAAVREFATSASAASNASTASISDIGTTLTALLWSGADFAIAHVGDSRAYLMRDGELSRLTQDHTYVRSLVEEGRLTPAEAETHPDRTRLLRALHAEADTEPDLHLRRARPGDRYLLCTDGIHAVVRGLEAVLTEAEPQEVVERLVAEARAAGAPDNLACVVIDVHGLH